MSRPRFTRVFSPPDRHANSRCRISLGMLRPLATLFTAVSVSQPPSPSNRAFSSPYRRSVASLLSPCSIRRASASISSFSRNIRAKAVCKTSSTVYPSGYTGICEISPTRRPTAICTSPSSGSSSPVSIRNTVVFPAPFRPSSPTRSPLSTWKLRPSSIFFSRSKDFTSPETRMSTIFLLFFYFFAAFFKCFYYFIFKNVLILLQYFQNAWHGTPSPAPPSPA